MNKELEMKSKRILITIFSLMVIASMALAACGGGGGAQSTGGKVKVGLSFSDFATERWKNEEVLMRGLLEKKGYEVISAEANHDVKLQNDQIDNMVSQGVKGLIVVAEDGDSAVTSVDKAAAAGVKVIAYDRLIKTSKIAAYLSFDNVEVGRQQALGVMTAMGLPGSTKWTKDNPIKLVQLAGSPTDNNATLFTKGQTEILQPYVDSGVVKIVAQQGVDNWDAANALKLMENILTAQGNKVDAVVASNDGTALGALQAMKAQGLAGKVPISGQDATADGSNSIVKGELTVSILKDIRNLSPLAIEVMDKLLKGQAVEGMKNFKLADLTVDPSKTGEVPCVFLAVQQVNKDNVYDLVVKSGFQKYDDVYRDIPADKRPPKPGEAAAPAAAKVKVGLSFSDFATERWKNEEVLMRGQLEKMGYEVISAEANHDVKLQNDQIDNMVTQGVKGLLVVAEDGDAIVTSVDKAADAGVKVIAYDRLIKTPKIAAYMSFDNVEVGRQQALGVMTAMGLPGSTKWTKDNPIKLVQLAGSPTDNNATLFTKGQTEILQPYVDSGVVKIVAQQGVDNWDAANALKLMENILTAQANKVDAVVASNDGTALGALQAMKAQGLAGKVPISGQDATADGCNSIVKGELTVSILKDFRNLTPLATKVMDQLIKGEKVENMKNFSLAELTVDPSKKGDVPCVFLEVQQVNKDNVFDLVVKSGFQAYDDVYRDIPAADRPAKP
jgi:D-xylose transport system substrate-binding protein